MDNAERFSDRVADYVKARPAYPAAVINVLRDHCALTPQATIADIGAGTGLLSQLFLQHGNTVYAVEPNDAMRLAAETQHRSHSGFHSIYGNAETTTLPSASVDFVTAGQAFHWFDRTAARREFIRILKPNGWVVLVYNERNHHGSAFQAAYEVLLQRYGTDYAAVPHHNIGEAAMHNFFARGQSHTHILDNNQHMDWPTLQARLLSSSYAPKAGSPAYTPMLAELRNLFAQHQQQDQIEFLYQTKITYGKLITESPNT